MLALAVVAPRLVTRATSEVPYTLNPRTDLVATIAVLIIGLVLVSGAIRAVCKRP